MTSAIPSAMRVERTVTLGLIVTILLQTAGGLIWVGAAEARLAELERKVDTSVGVSERLARLEGETAIVREQLARIERSLVHRRQDDAH